MMAQTLLFKEKPKLQLTETDTSWMVVTKTTFHSQKIEAGYILGAENYLKNMATVRKTLRSKH